MAAQRMATQTPDIPCKIPAIIFEQSFVWPVNIVLPHGIIF